MSARSVKQQGFPWFLSEKLYQHEGKVGFIALSVGQLTKTFPEKDKLTTMLAEEASAQHGLYEPKQPFAKLATRAAFSLCIAIPRANRVRQD
jgi:hypothetical protein